MGSPLQTVQPNSVMATDNSLEITFTDNRIDFDNNVPMRVLFRGTPWFLKMIFTGMVWDTQSDILGQPALEGDKNFDVSINSLRVALTQESVGEIVRGVAFTPPVFTPNGGWRKWLSLIIYRHPDIGAQTDYRRI